MYQRATNFIFALSILLATPLVAAQDVSDRSFQLPENGSFRLQVPQSWKDELRQPPGGLPPTIVFSSTTGESFKILVTPIFSVNEEMKMPTPSEIKKTVEKTVESVKNQAVEKKIPIIEFRGSSTIGYYFSVTDRSPKPGEYKYMTQGMFRVGHLAPTFTVLTNNGLEDTVSKSLKMIRDANHVY